VCTHSAGIFWKNSAYTSAKVKPDVQKGRNDPHKNQLFEEREASLGAQKSIFLPSI
jgi:hypothetical protein